MSLLFLRQMMKIPHSTSTTCFIIYIYIYILQCYYLMSVCFLISSFVNVNSSHVDYYYSPLFFFIKLPAPSCQPYVNVDQLSACTRLHICGYKCVHGCTFECACAHVCVPSNNILEFLATLSINLNMVSYSNWSQKLFGFI